MIFIGIDPGLDGAVAAIGCGSENDARAVNAKPIVVDTPTAKDGNKRRYLLACMVTDLKRIMDLGECCACIERVHAMPKQGVASSFTFGEGFGLWQGLLAGLNIPFDLVTPQAWKRELMAGAAKEKDASRIVAQRLFPSVDLSLKKHHGRADALLIAEYRRRRG